MLRNYKFIIAYDGTRFYGWEHQPGIEMTIQGKIENVLSRMLGKDVEVIGCGRTDAGVHAKAMVANAHFDTDSCVAKGSKGEMTEDEIRDYMNRYLPDDICINEVIIASDRFHARYNAIGKTYCYTCYVGPRKPVFDRKYVCVLDYQPDIDKMRQAAEYLIGQHDYASFCSNPRMKKSTVRKVDMIDITQKGQYIYMTFHGTGFLQHMVRILSGTLLEVGEGKRSPQSMEELINAKKRALAGFTAPAQGLCMIKVDYS